MWRSDTGILDFQAAIQYSYTNYLTFFASFPLLCYPFDLRPNVSKLSVDGKHMWNEKRAEDTSEADVLKTMYLLMSLRFPLRFSGSAFGWQSFLVPALLNSAIRVLFLVMTRSSSWHNFISRRMSFPGILCLPTCVFAKHLAYRECCNVPDLLVEAGKQPYVTTQWFAGAIKCRCDGVIYPASILSST